MVQSYLDQLGDVVEIDFDLQNQEPVEAGGGFTRFVKMTLFSVPVKLFQKGAEFSLVEDLYEFDEAAPMTHAKVYKGMQPVKISKTVFYVLVGNAENQKGEPMQFVTNWRGWGQDGINAWNDYQLPEVMKLSPADRKKLVDTGFKALKAGKIGNNFVYASYKDGETGLTGEYDPKKYWSDFVIFKSKAEFEAARTEYFEQFDQNEGEAVDWDTSIIPDMWAESSAAEFKQYFLEYHETGDKDQVLEVMGVTPSKELAAVVAGWLGEDGPAPTWSDQVKQYLP